MTPALPLHQIGINAMNVFTKPHDASRSSTGSNTNKMRAMGHAVESIILDCQVTNKRIAVILPDRATQFGIAVASKDDIDNTEEVSLPLTELNTSSPLEIYGAPLRHVSVRD